MQLAIDLSEYIRNPFGFIIHVFLYVLVQSCLSWHSLNHRWTTPPVWPSGEAKIWVAVFGALVLHKVAVAVNTFNDSLRRDLAGLEGEFGVVIRGAALVIRVVDVVLGFAFPIGKVAVDGGGREEVLDARNDGEGGTACEAGAHKEG